MYRMHLYTNVHCQLVYIELASLRKGLYLIASDVKATSYVAWVTRERQSANDQIGRFQKYGTGEVSTHAEHCITHPHILIATLHYTANLGLVSIKYKTPY